MKIGLLGRTQNNMKELLTLVKNKLGKSLKVDDLRLPPDHTLSFLATLTDFKDVMCDFTNLGSILRHEHYSYLLSCSERQMTEIVMESGLSFTTTPENDLAIVSGNLQQWQTAIISGCSEAALNSYREFTNLILADMERLGLKQLWTDFSKVYLKDTTFKLIEKK